MFYSGEEEKRKQENRGGEGKRAYVEVMKPDILMTTPHFISTKKQASLPVVPASSIRVRD
jgi:hypothetical protein